MAEEEKKVTGNTSPEPKKKKRSLFHKIVNVFLYFILGILVLFLIVIGITQTSTFREFARKTVLEEVNSTLNGRLNIEKLEGTILTSLILRNTTLTLDQDTILKAAVIEVRTSPLQLLLKRIMVRKVEIRDAVISLTTEENGELNLARLVPPTPEDTSSSEFPFTINLLDLSLKNVSFTHKAYDVRVINAVYDSLYFGDFRIDNLDMSLSAYADISNKNFDVNISDLSLQSNIRNFAIKEISGGLAVNQDGINLKNLKINTQRSNILIDASLTDFNLFDSTSEISHALLDVNIKGDKFHFADLRSFVPEMDIIDDEIYFNLQSSGSLKELEISTVEIEYLSTHLVFSGRIKDLDEPDNMFISVHSDEAHVAVPDINTLIPSISLPKEYNQAGIVIFDTLHYDGSPTNFKTHLYARTDVGNLYAQGLLDFRNEDMLYDLTFRTENFNIVPFTGVESSITSNGELKGKGTDLKSMNAVINYSASGTIAGNKLSNLELKSDAGNSVINYNLLAVSDSSNTHFTGFIDFTDENKPLYEFKGEGRNINIADYTSDSLMNSDLNFNMDASGESFDLENINLFLNLFVFDSELNGKKIDSTRTIVDLQKKNGDRIINIISDLADISITGNYSLEKSISLINREINILSETITERVNKFFPSQDTLIKSSIELASEDFEEFKTVSDGAATKIKYLIDLKDFELATLFLGESQLEINGEMFGDLVNNGDSISVNFGIKLDYVKYRTPESAMFLSKLNLDFRLSNSLSARTFRDISSSLNLTIDRIFAGSDVRDVDLNLELENNGSSFNFSANYNGNMSANLVGALGLSEDKINLVLDTLNVNYKNLTMNNKDQIKINFSDNGYEFEQFSLSRNQSNLNIKGSLLKSGSQDLLVTIDSLQFADMFISALNRRPEDKIDAFLNMKTHITGNMTKPVIDLDMSVDSISFRGNNFGSLLTAIEYNNRNVDMSIRFIERNKKENALLISGNIPMEISFAGADTLFEPGPMDVSLSAENFNLGALGDLVPQVSKLNGFLSASLNVTGTMDELQQSGYLALRNVSFVSDMNNLTYNAALKVSIDGENISVDSLVIQNSSDVSDGGTVTGIGKGQLDGFSLKSADISVGGRLKVLSENSRYAASPVYGDLVVATRGNIEFKIDDDGMFLDAPIIIKKANLTIPPTQGAYANTNRSFVYKFVQDTSDTVKGKMDFESLISYNQSTNNGPITSAKKNDFNYNINLEVEDEAKIVIILSNEINQNLTAVLNGNVIYKNYLGRSNIQGELKLLEGSTLEFMKTFKADGSIRFESDITNPYLNIVATYTDYYNPGDSTDTGTEIRVGVKIKIRGPLKELDKNFIKEEDNIAVYYGEKAIEDDEPDPTKDASDAVMFILTGRFKADLNQREQSAASSQFQGAATAIAGSVLGGVLNTYFGEYVTGVELRKVGTETKFLFTGRAGAFRYQVGGTQEVFQNLSQANVRIEYPVYLGLTLRFERREDVREGAVINEMVNELGLRYRFEF